MQRMDYRHDGYISSFRTGGAPPILDPPPRTTSEPAASQTVTAPVRDVETVPDVAPSRMTEWTPMQQAPRQKKKPDRVWLYFFMNIAIILLVTVPIVWDHAHPSPNEALVWAADDGDLAQATDAISKGADVNSGCGCQESPLQTASAKGHVAVARLLASKGAAIDAVNRAGESALSLAVYYRHAEVAAVLAETGRTSTRPSRTAAPCSWPPSNTGIRSRRGCCWITRPIPTERTR